MLITVLTTDFKDGFLSRYTWQAIFIIVGILSLVWLVRVLLKIPKLKKVDDIVSELMPPQEAVKIKRK